MAALVMMALVFGGALVSETRMRFKRRRNDG